MLRRTGFVLLLAACLLVSLRPANAQSDSVATVLKLQGMVSVIRDRSNYRTALYEHGHVRPGQLIVTGADGYAVFRVPDGSTFEVFPNSELRFRATMSIGDLLNVFLGKVKVYIQHLPGIPNPNNVTTPTALISVRGTVFTVDVQDVEGTTAISVDEGIVDVKNIRRGGKVVTLRPGEGITVDPNVPLVGLGGSGPRIYQALKLAVDATRDVMLQRVPGGSGGNVPGGGTSGGGGQGDQGKPGQGGGSTGTGSPTGGSGTGSPTGTTPGTPPPPPPGGGGD